MPLSPQSNELTGGCIPDIRHNQVSSPDTSHGTFFPVAWPGTKINIKINIKIIQNESWRCATGTPAPLCGLADRGRLREAALPIRPLVCRPSGRW